MRPAPSATSQPSVLHKWNEGTSVRNYADGARKWGTYTAQPGFIARFKTLVNRQDISNEVRSNLVEQFLIEEAVLAGVVTTSEIKHPLNPNKWGKNLAPWFT
jgi:hypothetical protein